MQINRETLKASNHVSWVLFFFVGAILLLPLFSAFPYFAPPAWGQAIAFRFLVVLLFFFTLFHSWQAPRQKTDVLKLISRIKIPLLTLGGYLTITSLATLFSLDPSFSLWGTPWRAWGVLNDLLYALFALLLLGTLKPKGWHFVWNILFTVGFLASLIALFQQLGLLEGLLVSDSRRPASTFGNSLFLALFLATLLPFLAHRFLQAAQTKMRFVYGFLAFFFLYTVLLTETRAVFLALAFAIPFFLYFYPQRIRFLKPSITIGTLLGILLLLSLNIFSPPQSIQGNFLGNLWGRLEIAQIIQEEPRFAAWPHAIQAMKEKPFLGYGPYNSSIAFDRYFDSREKQFAGRTTGWWDTFHNLYLDIAIGTGLLGLAAFLFFLGSLFWQLQLKRTREQTQTMKLHVVQTAFLIYVVSMFFSFPSFATSLIFFVLIGYSFFLLSYEPKLSS